MRLFSHSAVQCGLYIICIPSQHFINKDIGIELLSLSALQSDSRDDIVKTGPGLGLVESLGLTN